jgi:hypothetical protein
MAIAVDEDICAAACCYTMGVFLQKIDTGANWPHGTAGATAAPARLWFESHSSCAMESGDTS